MATAGDLVAAEIREVGPIGFDRFMDLALYSPEGFFGSGRGAGGHGGDFITSVEVGPLFAQLVARWLDRVWEELGRPSPYLVAEVGAGRGQLAAGVLAAEPDCGQALRLELVERSPVLAAQASERLDAVSVLPELGDSRRHVVFANELLDNLGFAIVEVDGGQWVELRVTVGADGFGLAPASLGEPDSELLARVLPDAPPGARIPLARRAAEWVSSVQAEVVCVIDYTATTAEMAERPGRGWMRTYSGHGRGTDVLSGVGSQDITADVPVDQLPRPSTNVSQAEWLTSLGADGMVAEGNRIWTERAAVADLAALMARSRGTQDAALRDPDGLGGFRVLTWNGSVRVAP